MMKQKNWYYLIDGIRGFALVNMILFHFLYDMFIVFDLDPDWLLLPYVSIWQQFICISFIFISGISWHFSRHNIRRGLLLNLYGAVITLVTILVLPSESIWFGILNFIGCAVLLMSLLDKQLRSLPPVAGFAGSLLLFFLFRPIGEGYLGLGGLRFVTLPDWLYDIRLLTFLGMPHRSFYSSDFFPILPWFFLFTAGYWSWKLILQRESLLNLCKVRLPLLSAIGSKSIWIYLAHQPVLYGLAWLLAFRLK